MSSTQPFVVQYQNDQLICKPTGIQKIQAEYLSNYISQVNRYQKIAEWEGSPVFSLYQPPPATKAGMRSIQHRLMRRFEQKRFPATATISITKACQCDCTHCSAVYYNNSSKKMLSFAEYQSALLQSVELGVTTLILLGGEPLLFPQIIPLIQSVPKDLSTVIMFSNGEFFTKDICKQLKEAGLLGVFISIDSMNANEHDALRKRPGLFNKAMESIENLKAAEILVGISSYLSHSRVGTDVFHQMMEFGKSLQIHEITFFDAIPTGNWLHKRDDLLTPEDRQKIQDWVKSYRSKKVYPGLSVQSTMTSDCGSAFCFAANTQFYLTAFGEMCPCDFTPLTIGKFPEQSIAELWQKMIHTNPYQNRAKSCRMQDETFYQKYLANIPAAGPFPFQL